MRIKPIVIEIIYSCIPVAAPRYPTCDAQIMCFRPMPSEKLLVPTITVARIRTHANSVSKKLSLSSRLVVFNYGQGVVEGRATGASVSAYPDRTIT